MEDTEALLDERIDKLADAVELTADLLRAGGNSIRLMQTELHAAREGHDGQRRNTLSFKRERDGLLALLREAGAATSFMPDEWKQRAKELGI